jgi:hypothetical protein
MHLRNFVGMGLCSLLTSCAMTSNTTKKNCEPGFRLTAAGYLGTGAARTGSPQNDYLFAQGRADEYIEIALRRHKLRNEIYSPSQVVDSYITDGTTCVTVLLPYN